MQVVLLIAANVRALKGDCSMRCSLPDHVIRSQACDRLSIALLEPREARDELQRLRSVHLELVLVLDAMQAVY